MPVPHFPGPRLAYDQDGTIGFIPVTANRHVDKGTLLELPSDALRILNSDTGYTLAIQDDNTVSIGGASHEPSGYWDFPDGSPAPNFLSLVFPVPTRIRGWFCTTMALTTGNVNGQGWVPVEVQFSVSHNTTNGMDGDWSMVDLLHSDDYQINQRELLAANSSTPYYGIFIPPHVPDQSELVDTDQNRYSSTPEDGWGWRALFGGVLKNVAGVRLDFPSLPGYNGSVLWLNLHLYGDPDTLTSPHRVVFEDPDTGTEFTSIMSVGDVGLESETDDFVRVRNLSDSLTATEVSVTTEPASSEVFLSLDGDVWIASVELPPLLPDEYVDIHVRVAPSAGTVGLRFVRLLAVVEWD